MASSQNIKIEREGDTLLPEKLFTIQILEYGEPSQAALEHFWSKFPNAKDFFYPSLGKVVYQSRSGAMARAALLEDNGIKCRVLVCNPTWEVYETQREKLARLEAENVELRERLRGVA